MYHAHGWHEAYVVLGGGAAALAGLIIVSASVRADQILTVPHWRLLARNTTLSMIAIMITSVLILLPQSSTALGIEIVVVNLIAAIFLPCRVILHVIRSGANISIRVPLIAAFLYVLAIGGGVSLIAHWGGGLFLVTAAYLLYLPLAVVNAYVLLVPHNSTPA